MSMAEKLTTIAENQEKVYEAGKEQRDYEWWDRYQKQFHGMPYETARTNYLYAFAGTGWDDTTYNPLYPIVPKGNAQRMYYQSNITDTKVDIDATQCAINWAYVFDGADHLVTIRKLIVSAERGMSIFSGCTRLQNIVIEGEIGQNVSFSDCPLTVDSCKSVINALKDLTGAANKTLALKATCWEALNADSAPPNGATWQEYVQSLGWTVSET